ncbi:MAG: hypothetical protein K6G15_08335 [Desulfovibrio sp.]|nr:hypothetical protein [Desulfovibrio sp.]
MFLFMLFIFLGFLSLLAVNLYLLVSFEKTSRKLLDEQAQLRLLLQAMEARLRTGEKPDGEKALALETEALLHLDFSQAKKAAKPCDPALDLHLDDAQSPTS